MALIIIVSTLIFSTSVLQRFMFFRAEVTVTLKNGMLDPEAATIKKALKHLGYNCRSVKQAAVYELEFEADSRENANDVAKGMCERLLANPIIHDYNIVIAEPVTRGL